MGRVQACLALRAEERDASHQVYLLTAKKTREEDKKHVLYPGGHGLWWPFSRQIKTDVLDWLDRYFGPVE